MSKQNKKITVVFELNKKGFIIQVHAFGLPADFTKSLINSAAADIDNIIKPDHPGNGYAPLLPPGDRVLNDANYILSGGRFTDLAEEN